MSRIVELLQRFAHVVLQDEDGEELKVSLSKGADFELIEEFENKENIKLSTELKELLTFSDGLVLFGQQILSLAEMEYFASDNIVSFHAWGNGDFDCVSIKQQEQGEMIYFMSHSVDNLTPVHSSLFGWIKDVIAEIQQKGALLHPYDFTERNEEGIYKSVVKKKYS